MSYQESHWDNEAKSPTGVRGLMMLTERTAKQLRVSRSNPGESVHGGSRYLADLRERLPASIAEPERTLFALAAYNVGLGHLEDARVLAERGGLDPNAWSDVRRELPLLADPEVAKVVRHGRARGAENEGKI